jgi:hypothetical protein
MTAAGKGVSFRALSGGDQENAPGKTGRPEQGNGRPHPGQPLAGKDNIRRES